MATNGTISISFVLKDSTNGMKTLTMGTADLKKVLSATAVEAEKLKKPFINFASLATGINAIQGALSGIKSTISDLTKAYSAQIEAETKLANVMRNTMGATDADIQSIKDLCAAQQQLGVIGDEVQLAGAQELATYLGEKESLEKLIPVMNDMLAQQYGLNATQESAANIATMLGKVMDGQTGALSRYGYKFDEAQEKILKFGDEAERVAVLADVVSASVGGTNAALAQTDAGEMKQLSNWLGDCKEQAGAFVQAAEPITTVAANTGIALGGVIQLYHGFGILKTSALSCVKAMRAWWAATAVMSSKTTGLTKAVGTARLFITEFGRAVVGGTKSLKLFAMAWRGMLISTGIGLAIAAVTTIIYALSDAADEATESTHKFLSAAERAEKEAEAVKRAQEDEAAAYRNSSALLNINIQTLKDFTGSKEKEKKLVAEMNDTYGNSMGYYSSVADWYKALVANSEAYCRQMVIEARTRSLADRIAAKETERDDLQRKIDNKEFSDAPKRGEAYETGMDITGAPTYDWTILPSDMDNAKAEVELINAEVADLTDQFKKVAEEAKSVKMPEIGAEDRPNLDEGKDTKKEKTRIQELDELISKAKLNYVNASEEKRQQISKDIKAWEDEKRSIEELMLEAGHRVDLSSIEGISNEIAYQQQLRKRASADSIAGYDAEIERLQKLQSTMELNAYTPVGADKIDTYEQLNKEIEYYSKKLQTGTESERIFAQQNLTALNRKKETMDELLDLLEQPADIATVKTLSELDRNIEILDRKIQAASVDEIAALQKTRQAFEEKKKAYERGIRIPDLQKEADEINALTGQAYRIKIEAMGFDELTEKITELKRELEDLDNPPTDGQRQAIEKLMGTYEKWRADGVRSFDTFVSGWNSIKGIGGGIESMTDAITGNGNAWQRITGIVDGFIQLYEGITSIIKIINMLSAVTNLNAAAKTTEAGAEIASTTAKGANAIAAEAEAAATLPVIAANKAATASFMELAAASYFAAHAYIPFAGFGIASGFVGAAKAMVAGIGMTPFADGGIVSGPTVGLIGEYAGASNNPEVVAPLDKLRNILNDTSGQSIGGKVVFRIDGRTLVGVLEREQNIRRRG